MTRFPYVNARDQIESAYDPEGIIREMVQDGSIHIDNAQDVAYDLLGAYIALNAEDGMTIANTDLTPDDFLDYILDLFEEYDL